MKYYIKNRVFSDAIKRIIDPQLLEKQIEEQIESENLFLHVKTAKQDIGIYFPRSFIAGTVPYNPKDWNNFPDSIPPSNTWMRVIRKDYKMDVAYYESCTEEWTTQSFQKLGQYLDETQVVKFKPWDDDEI